MLAHFTLATRDVAGTSRFFQETLGWKPIRMPGNIELEADWLDVGQGVQAHILGIPNFMPSPHEQEFGRHFAVFYSGREFAGLKQRLVEHGAELIPPIRPTPFERFFFRDPNGYMWEVIDRDHFVAE